MHIKDAFATFNAHKVTKWAGHPTRGFPIILIGQEDEATIIHETGESVRWVVDERVWRDSSTTVHPLGEVLALTDGEVLGLLPIPITADQGEGAIGRWMKPGFESIHFDATGEYLWTLNTVSDDVVAVRNLDLETRKFTATLTLNSPYPDGASFGLVPTNNPHVALLEVYDLDVVTNYFIRRDGDRLVCQLAPKLEDHGIYAFSGDGSELLARDEVGALVRFSFPELNALGSWRQFDYEDAPDDFGLVEIEGPIEFLHAATYLTSTLALLEMQTIWLLLDVQAMKIVRQMQLEGCPVRTPGLYDRITTTVQWKVLGPIVCATWKESVECERRLTPRPATETTQVYFFMTDQMLAQSDRQAATIQGSTQ